MLNIPGYNPIRAGGVYYKEKDPKKDFSPVCSVILTTKYHAPTFNDVIDYIRLKRVLMEGGERTPDQNVSLEILFANMPDNLFAELEDENLRLDQLYKSYQNQNVLPPDKSYLHVEHGWIPTPYLVGAISQEALYGYYKNLLHFPLFLNTCLGTNIHLRVELDQDKPVTSLSKILTELKGNFFQPIDREELMVSYSPVLTPEHHLFDFLKAVYTGIAPHTNFSLQKILRKKTSEVPIEDVYDSSWLVCDSIARTIVLESLIETNRENTLSQINSGETVNFGDISLTIDPKDDNGHEDDDDDSGDNGPSFQ
ncbi:MAG: hypothetical protein Q8Q01_01385 [archaeon]|nr:hypothetical protein [archaeon]